MGLFCNRIIFTAIRPIGCFKPEFIQILFRLDYSKVVSIIRPSQPTDFLTDTHTTTYYFAAAFAAGTSSSSGRMSGTGPTGVMANGLICAWLLV